jgi:RNA-directed DNA polymerase
MGPAPVNSTVLGPCRRCKILEQDSRTRAFYRSALYPLLSRINAYLMRWARKKYKRLRTIKKAAGCWQRITRQYPRLFAHWAWAHGSWWSG